MDDADFADSFARAKQGDVAAIRELLRRFEEEVRLVVRTRLPRVMRSQYDSMDFVQDVWQSLFRGEGLDLDRFTSPKHLLGYLIGVARNKVLEEHRKRTSLKYNISRQEPLFVRQGNREVLRDLPASDPSPSKDAQAGDRLAQIMSGRSPHERRIVELRCQHLTYEEIAERLDIHESAVRRTISSIRERLERKT